MPRLFVALRPPEPVRKQLLAAMGGVEGARWQTDNQLHLTLAFLGELDRHQADDMVQALANVLMPPFDMRLSHWGSFSAARAGRTSVLWIGVEPVDLLSDLASRVRLACRRAGLAPDMRRFVPHITMARFSGGGAAPLELRRFLSEAPPTGSWTAEEFWLVESRLGQSGAHYEPVASYALTGSFGDRYR